MSYQNILTPTTNLDLIINNNINDSSFNINYYKSPSSLNIASSFNYNNSYSDEINDILHKTNLQTNNYLNYLNSNYSCNTPIMNLDIRNEKNDKTNFIENKTNDKSKIEVISIDTSDSSKNVQIEILPRIENIVSTANLCCPLNLRQIALQAKNAEYNPKRFSAVIMKLKEPKTTALIFSSGRIVTLGAKTEEDSRKSCRKFAKIIKSLNYDVAFKEFKIQNIVGAVDIKFQISLMKLYIYLVKKCSTKGVVYEPELFPGLIYRMIEPNIVLLIFVSGKLVLTGGKSREDIYQGFKNIYPILVKFKMENNNKNSKLIHQENKEKIKSKQNEELLI